jgi:trk system potassium uptake protein TrkH
MNYRMLGYLLGIILLIEAALLSVPTAVSMIFGEPVYPFLITMAALLAISLPLAAKKPKNTRIYAREGFVCVALAWLAMSLFGALPFVISGAIPSYVNALFETVSGFTTTGATILTEIESLPKGILFWRSFTHWIGGMGVLVLMLAVLPSDNGRAMYLLRAEVPGPTKDKLVPKMRQSAMILYGIYVALTVAEIIALLCTRMPFYDSVVNALATAGTGGFSVKNASIAAYNNPAAEWVIAIFMLIFSINFNLYYLILIGHVSQALKSEELRWFAIVVGTSTAVITLNILPTYDSFGLALRDAAFNVSSFISTTGFTTATYDAWPQLSQAILVLLMFIGGCAGSTCGGLKISRLLILIKSALRELRFTLRPREVRAVRVEDKPVDDDTIRGVNAYFSLFMLIFTLSTILLLVIEQTDLLTAFTSVASCLNNVGPGLGEIGILGGGSFGGFTVASKLLLSFNMLLGRLELFPILILFLPTSWSKK